MNTNTKVSAASTKNRNLRYPLAWRIYLSTALAIGFASFVSAKSSDYRSPFDVRFSPDGKQLAVSDHTKGVLYILDAAAGKIEHTVPLAGLPTSLAWQNSSTVLVCEYDAGTLAQVDARGGEILRRFPTAPKPAGIAVRGNTAVVTEYGKGQVAVLDLSSGIQTSVKTSQQPFFAAINPSGNQAIVGHLIPDGVSSNPALAAKVTLIDPQTCKVKGEIELPDGSTNVRGVAISSDGQWGYVVHTRGRVALPTTQLDRGWTNTNALSILDLKKQTRVITVLLDYVQKGAADPWGIASSPDGKTVWITIAGTNEIAAIDVASLRELISGKGTEKKYDSYSGSAAQFWAAVSKDPAKVSEAVNHLSALYGMGLIQRSATPLLGPRAIDISPDCKTLAAGGYFSGGIALFDAKDMRVLKEISLGGQPPMDKIRKGEAIFHSANYCFQQWLTCATCHPASARADGLNWDLLNDGIGNSKNTKSLLWAYQTPPSMSLGVRDSMETASRKGFQFIAFYRAETEDLSAINAYLSSLAPEPSPWLVNGSLSEKAQRGKKIFESRQAGCSTCHPAPLFTTLKLYDVGTKGNQDHTGKFDTPSLVEMWRSAPYLHDGSAAAMIDVLVSHNMKDQHGRTSHLSKEDLDALVEYLLSL